MEVVQVVHRDIYQGSQLPVFHRSNDPDY
jgi:hypothetical protein